MPPKIKGTSGKASRQRWLYTMAARSGRLPPTLPGV